MAKSTKNQILIEFLDYYFKVPKKQYLKSEISHYKSLIEIGILCENDLNNSILEIDNSSIKLLDTILEFAEIKTNKKLPIDLSEAFSTSLAAERFKPFLIAMVSSPLKDRNHKKPPEGGLNYLLIASKLPHSSSSICKKISLSSLNSSICSGIS